MLDQLLFRLSVAAIDRDCRDLVGTASAWSVLVIVWILDDQSLETGQRRIHLSRLALVLWWRCLNLRSESALSGSVRLKLSQRSTIWVRTAEGELGHCPCSLMPHLTLLRFFTQFRAAV